MRTTRVFLLSSLLLAALVGGFRWFGVPTAIAAPSQSVDAPAALPIIDDFEAGVPGTFFQYGDYGSGTAINLTTTVASLPGAASTNVLSVSYTSAGWGAGIGNTVDKEDWTSYDGFSFWFRGANNGGTFRVILSDNGDPNLSGDTAERFAYEFVDNSTAWRYVSIPWTAFFRDPGFQPSGAPNDGLTLTAVEAYAIALPVGTSSTVMFDDIRLFKTSVIDSFEAGVPGTFFQYGDYGSGTAINLTTTVATLPVASSTNVLSVSYTSAGWGAGIGNTVDKEDWTSFDGFSFWFMGANTGGTFRVILSDNGDPNLSGDTAERFAYEWTDNSTGWQHVSIPWAAFFRDPGFQPSGAPNDGLTLTAVEAYAFALPSGTSATVMYDGVALYGPLLDTQATFNPRNISVDEGNMVTLTVSLNVTSTNTVSVDYMTVDGSATAGSDYTAKSGTLTIPAGNASGEIVVATTDDSDVEGGETFHVVLSNPVSVSLTSQVTATVTIKDNDQAPPAVGGGHSVIVDNYELNALPFGLDSNSIGIGYVTFNAPGASASVTLTVPSTQVPGKAAGNKVARMDLNLGAGQWGGFTHAFENAAVDTWITQDWSTYVGVSFWLYGNNTGSVIFVDLQENRKPGSTADDAERWSIDLQDDFEGWKFFEIPFTDFNRKDIGNGAPDDGFDGTEMHGYAFGGFNTIANKSYYIDDFGLMPRTTVVDDYELDALPYGTAPVNLGVGFVTFNAPGASAGVTLTVPSTQVPGSAAGNKVLQMDLNLGAGQWGGFAHAFENEALDAWITRDWSTYEGICFWLYGNNTGSVIFVDLQENRKPGSTTDDAERWSIDLQDDFDGWKFFQIPFSDFNRKDIGNGAPDDGFDGSEMHGYAFGGFNTIANKSYYIDDVTVYGDTGSGPKPVTVAFSGGDAFDGEYLVSEGATAILTVSLNMTSTETVIVDYKSMESQATAGEDYTPISGTVTFAPGVQHMNISLPTMDDVTHEKDEKIAVNLYNPQGAAFGHFRRSVVTIQDNDPGNPADVENFHGAHPFMGSDGVALSITELMQGDTNAVPDQGAYEEVLTVEYDTASTTPNHATTTFAEPRDWSMADGLTFWYFGNNTGANIGVELLDNQVANTNQVTTTQWVMRWSDEFNEAAGTPPNPNNWQHELGDGILNGLSGWGNSELQYYTDDPANASTDGNGNLVLRMQAVDENTTDLVCHYGPCRYTSARLISSDLAEFKYGKIEARMKLPPTMEDGLWPAFWALGSKIDEGVDWPLAGEIDIMEYVSRVKDEVFGTLHGPGYSGGSAYGQTYSVPNLLDDYHTYTIEWRENHIIWYFDGVKFHEARNTDPYLTGKQWVYNQPFFLLLNMAIGGNFGGKPSDQIAFPQDTLVDYVRVYQAADSAERFETSFVDDFTGWKKVVVMFNDLTRSAQQPAGAPDDGLTLTEVNGYGFHFPSSAAGTVNAQALITTHIDQVRLLMHRLHGPIVFKQ